VCGFTYSLHSPLHLSIALPSSPSNDSDSCSLRPPFGLTNAISVFETVEDSRPLCQLSSKRLEDIWHSGLLSSTKIGFLEGAHPIVAELTMCGLPGVEPQIVAVL